MMPTRMDADRLENDVYRYVDVGVLITKKRVDGKRKRRIEQICYFVREKKRNIILPVAMDGELAIAGKDLEELQMQFDPEETPELFSCDELKRPGNPAGEGRVQSGKGGDRGIIPL